MINILFEGWPFLQHSYGQVLAFKLIHLFKLYGYNGKLGHKLNIYIKEVEYYNNKWHKTQKLVYTEEYNSILRNLQKYKNENIDLIYRISYPYNINSNNDIPICIFYTSEFSYLDSNYFKFNNSNIKDYLAQHNNIYLTAPSLWSANGLNNYILDTNRNRVITHGVDTTIFYKHNTNEIRNKIRTSYKIKDNDILMINIGAMTNNKGIHLIIETLFYLVYKLDKLQYKLILKGSGDLYTSKDFIKNYFHYFKTNNIMKEYEINNLIKNHIIFINETLNYSKINDLFNASDLYLSPYLAEGFGLTMLEALASGLNVVIPNTGSTKEYMNDIYNNTNKDYIYYINSIVVTDNNKFYNQIEINDILNILVTNENEFKKNKSKDSYNKLQEYINKEYSWYKVSELLFDYFQYILNK
jgi:glycosyltransferase involved in cell wall biosynthesis